MGQALMPNRETAAGELPTGVWAAAVGFCWIALFAEAAGPVIPRARNLSIRVIEQNPTSGRAKTIQGQR